MAQHKAEVGGRKRARKKERVSIKADVRLKIEWHDDSISYIIRAKPKRLHTQVFFSGSLTVYGDVY